MFSKIDKSICDRIKILDNDSQNIDVVIYSKFYNLSKNYFERNKISYVELPFISSFALSVNSSRILNMAKQESVAYISSISKVSSLIFKSKKLMNIKLLEDNIKSFKRHSVVIIDTGIYPHIDFCLGRNRIIKFIDLINLKEDCYDDNGHGTFVAGILGAKSITSRYSGIDSGVDIIAIKALDELGETSSLNILKAMQWIVDNKTKYNIKVVCMSFGSLFETKYDPLIRGAEVLWNNGITVVCAGGNSGPDESTIMSPGASKKVITVGSIDNSNNVAKFSSRGPVLNYYKPDIVTPGVEIISTAIFSKTKQFYTKMSGTSVSTPMVAGVASLLYRYNDRFSPDDIKYRILSFGEEILGDKNSEGFGILKIDNMLQKSH